MSRQTAEGSGQGANLCCLGEVGAEEFHIPVQTEHIGQNKVKAEEETKNCKTQVPDLPQGGEF